MDTSHDYKLSITRLNMISAGRMAIKTLIDKSCFESVDDTSSEVFNFCNIIENMFYFCIQSGEAMHSANSKKHPWHLIKFCFGPSKCIPVISGMDNLKHNFARLRAWILYALLEKKLHDYLEYLHRSIPQIKKFYTNNCVFMCPEYQHFTDSLLGLKAIDFNVDLKGENLNHFGFHPIDYTPYLKYVQNPLSMLDDLVENCNHDSDSGNMDDHSSILSSSCPWKEKFLKIETKLKTEVEQKGYLEEMLRVKDDQVKNMESSKRDAFLEMKQLENVVLELQIQLTLLHEQYSQEISTLDSRCNHHLPSPRLHSSAKSPPPLSALNQACSFSANDDTTQPHPPRDALHLSAPPSKRNVFENSLEDCHSERLRVVQPGVLILPTDKHFKVGCQELHYTKSYQTPPRKFTPSLDIENVESNLLHHRAVRLSDGTDSAEEERLDEGEDALHSEVFLNVSSQNEATIPVSSSQNSVTNSLPLSHSSEDSAPQTVENQNPSSRNSGDTSSLEFESIDTPEVVRRARGATESHYYQLIGTTNM